MNMCEKLTVEMLSDNFCIEDNLGHSTKYDYSIAHFLCEAARTVGCNGLGGEAFRHWVSGLYKDGVYVYTDNYDVGISFASNPQELSVRNGCQQSCSSGNPWPRLKDGEWIRIDSTYIPDDVREKVCGIANKIVKDAAKIMLEKIERDKLKLEEQESAGQKRNEKIVEAWRE